jgi:hypothetical protein
LKEEKNELENKKNTLDTELSKYQHLLFLNITNYNKNESQNLKDLSNAISNLQYFTHKTIREINLEILSLKSDIEIMEHDLELYEKGKIYRENNNIYLYNDKNV